MAKNFQPGITDYTSTYVFQLSNQQVEIVLC